MGLTVRDLILMMCVCVWQWYTIPLLFLRFLVPLALLTYGIKKNPFYRSYPIMLPIMIASWFIVLYRAVVYSKRTNRMVH